MGWYRRKFVAQSRQWAVMDSLARHIATANLAIERLERTGGSERAKNRWRRQIERMRALRMSIIDNDWEALVR